MDQNFVAMRIAVLVIALIAAILSFGIYFLIAIGRLKPDQTDKAHAAADEAVGKVKSLAPLPSPAEAAELVKALASLGESLTKAGPALWSLIGSALFLFIAALSAGVFQQAASAPSNSSADASNATDASNASDAASNTALPPDENVKVE